MRKICLMGASFDTGNQGVSALAASLVELVREAAPDAAIYFFVGSRQGGRREINMAGESVEYNIIGYRLSPKAPVQDHLLWIFALALIQWILPFGRLRERIRASNPCLDALATMDFVGDIHGGDSFSDIYGLRGFIESSITNLILLLLGKRLVFLPQTYGPYGSFCTRLLARFILKRAVQILSRDRQSIELIKELLGNSAKAGKIDFCPDVAFCLKANTPSELAVLPPFKNGLSQPKIVGFNVNGLLYNGGYTRDNMFGLKFDYSSFAIKMASGILHETDCDVLLVPHTYAPENHVESDPSACKAVFGLLRDEFQGRVHLVTSEYDQSGIKGVIGLSDFFIGSRMHACIGALSQGIPTVGIAYSKKFKGVFNSIGLDDMALDARLLDEETIIQQTLRLIRSDDYVQLTERVTLAKQQLKEIFGRILTDSNP